MSKYIIAGWEEIEVLDRSCYLVEMITPGGDCKAATLISHRTVWVNFKELLPLPLSRCLSLSTRVFALCVWSALFRASECWAIKKDVLFRLRKRQLFKCYMINYLSQHFHQRPDLVVWMVTFRFTCGESDLY